VLFVMTEWRASMTAPVVTEGNDWKDINI
jgi:hypothetical protein